jgi:DNA invertase Pin-like site-specific DNA recombinase
MKYGYARVSTEDQHQAKQLASLKKAGCKTVFKVTGAHVKRPALTRCLKKLETGDTLVVWKLDRLGRSLRDLIAILVDFKQRAVKFICLTEASDTESPTGRAMWQMVGVLAELERSLITEGTRSGRKAAQRRGVKFGRKPKLTPDRLAHARKLINQGTAPTQAAKMIGVSRATVYRALQREAAKAGKKRNSIALFSCAPHP